MNKSSKQIIWLLAVLLVVVAMFDLLLGSVSISVSQLVDILALKKQQSMEHLIIWDYRIPKMLTTILTGFALPLSGMLMQTIFRNPLSGPFVLGVSSGAGLGVAMTLMLASGSGFVMFDFVKDLSVVLAGSIGAFAVMLIILLISERIKNLSSLLIVGIMIASFASAIIGVLQYFSSNDELRNYVIWSMGSLSNTSWNEIIIISIIIVVSTAVVFWLSKGLNALAIGERYAHTLGVDVVNLRRFSLFIASILAGTITSVVGPIAFIGLAIPHVAKSLLNSVNHRLLIPVTMLLGANMMLVFEIVSQLVLTDQIIPINIITSLFGAPFVVFIIMRRNSKIAY